MRTLRNRYRAGALTAALVAVLAVGLGVVIVEFGQSSSATERRTYGGAPGLATAGMTIGTVGGLFTAGNAPNTLTPDSANGHYCSASVVDSADHDTILTAAHCVTGTGKGLLFAPGYDSGKTPEGVWTVIAAYVAPEWVRTGDQHYDYAFLQIAPMSFDGSTRSIQSVTGGEFVGTQPAAGRTVTVAGYTSGIDDDPVICNAQVYYTSGYPTFDCDGFAGGTSGSPWLVHRAGTTGTALNAVVAEIGGLYQGGCVASTSYSPAFGQAVLNTLYRAGTKQGAVSVPAPGASGC